VVFLPVVGFDWVWDDRILILENSRISGVDGLVAGLSGGLWDHTPSANAPPLYYRPVMRWSLVLDHALGLSAGLAHLQSLVVHLLAAAGVFALSKRLLGSAQTSALVAALYGLHPLQVEAVGWVSARNDLQAAAASVWAAAFLFGTDHKRRWLAVFGLTAVAAASKESAYLMPLALGALAWGWERLGEPGVRNGVFGAILGVALVLGLRMGVGVAWPSGADAAHLAAAFPPILSAGLEALVWPVQRAPGLHLAWPQAPAWAAVGVGVVGILLLLKLGGRRAAGALGLAVVTALPAWAAVSHVGLFGDRYLVLPLAGVALSAGACVKGRGGQLGLLVVALGLAGLTTASLGTWRDDLSLWTAAAERHANPHTAGSLAKALELSGDLDGAAAWYQKATVAPRPLEHACWNVAAIHLKRGQPGQAAEAGTAALDNGCPPSGELVCPTALGLAWTGRFDASLSLLPQADSDPAGLCRLVGLVDAARRDDWGALNAVLQSDNPDERAALAVRLVRVLEAGGDRQTVQKVQAWARPSDEGPVPR